MTAFLRTLVLTFLTVTFLTSGQTANADEHEIKYRKNVMSAIGGTMGSLAAILKKQAPAKHAGSLALTMSSLASIVPDLFPEGSDFGETGALPAIWEKPDDFKAAVQAFNEAATAMPDAAAAGGEAYKKAFVALGKSCKGCHETFRHKHQH